MNNDIKKDGRYSIQPEGTGLATQQWVVRFCGEWVGSNPSYQSAVIRATDHNRMRLVEPRLEEFTAGYMTALLWSSTDEVDGENVNLDNFELSTAGADKCRADCRAFVSANLVDLEGYAEQRQYDAGQGTAWEHAGHDFALTRNGHGAGYWDRTELDKDLATRLTKASAAAGTVEPYVGDDGEVYVS